MGRHSRRSFLSLTRLSANLPLANSAYFSSIPQLATTQIWRSEISTALLHLIAKIMSSLPTNALGPHSVAISEGLRLRRLDTSASESFSTLYHYLELEWMGAL
ncbi:hypothetical protein EDB83DRAFT_2461957 [Lactarius deliciosus]|nr:hypothetical protein EDB83DRAFT_2461957 [Lactarius deliciosus]